MAVPTIITTNATPPPISPNLPDPLSSEVGLDTMIEEAPPPVSDGLQRTARGRTFSRGDCHMRRPGQHGQRSPATTKGNGLGEDVLRQPSFWK